MKLIFSRKALFAYLLAQAVWIIVLTFFRPIGEYLSNGRGRRKMSTLVRVVFATVTFLFFFYSATIAMSFMYTLDSALLGF